MSEQQNGDTKPTEAVVKVLTAEVRVLMVGSRQVTLGVFNQLDWCSPWPRYFQPMGRINHKEGEYYIGVDRDGTLVRAEPPVVWYHLGLQVCRASLPAEARVLGWKGTLEFAGFELTFTDWTVETCLREPESERDRQERIRHIAKCHWPLERLWEKAYGIQDQINLKDRLHALPLIVLAGLR